MKLRKIRIQERLLQNRQDFPGISFGESNLSDEGSSDSERLLVPWKSCRSLRGYWARFFCFSAAEGQGLPPRTCLQDTEMQPKTKCGWEREREGRNQRHPLSYNTKTGPLKNARDGGGGDENAKFPARKSDKQNGKELVHISEATSIAEWASSPPGCHIAVETARNPGPFADRRRPRLWRTHTSDAQARRQRALGG